MISFFRKIRKKLLNEGKTARYLKYALGEILLVVIGILIALQINNWNQEKQLAKEELKILKSLHNEMKENLTQFEQGFTKHQIKKDGLYKLITDDLSQYSIEELDKLSISYINHQTYNPSFSVYDTLVSSGKIELISNDSLKYRVSKHRDIVVDYKEGEVLVKNNTRDHNWSFLIKQSAISAKYKFNLKERNETEKAQDLENYLTEYQSDEFQNAMSLLYLNMAEVISDGEGVHNEIISLIEMLDQEILSHD